MGSEGVAMAMGAEGQQSSCAAIEIVDLPLPERSSEESSKNTIKKGTTVHSQNKTVEGEEHAIPVEEPKKEATTIAPADESIDEGQKEEKQDEEDDNGFSANDLEHQIWGDVEATPSAPVDKS